MCALSVCLKWWNLSQTDLVLKLFYHSNLYFRDDMNMPEVDFYGTVQPHTLIRQHLDYHHWYNHQHHYYSMIALQGMAERSLGWLFNSFFFCCVGSPPPDLTKKMLVKSTDDLTFLMLKHLYQQQPKQLLNTLISTKILPISSLFC